MKLFGKNSAVFTKHINPNEQYIALLFASEVKDNNQLTDDDIKIIESFLEKNDAGMELDELRVIVKMQYAMYKQMMMPRYIINLGKGDSYVKD